MRISRRGLVDWAQMGSSDTGDCTMKTDPKKVLSSQPALGFLLFFYFRLGRSLLLEQRLWLFSRDSLPTVARQTLNLLIRSYK